MGGGGIIILYTDKLEQYRNAGRPKIENCVFEIFIFFFCLTDLLNLLINMFLVFRSWEVSKLCIGKCPLHYYEGKAFTFKLQFSLKNLTRFSL